MADPLTRYRVIREDTGLPTPQPILAIDFGTSASSAVLVAGEREHPVKDSVTGSYSWPSSVFLEDDRLMVGAAAEQRKRSAPDRYRAGFKRDLGARSPILLGGKRFEVTELVAHVLRRLREEAERLAGRPIERAVLTMPSSYGEFDDRRAAMIGAGREAGFAGVDLLQEPVAAALAPLVGEPFAAGDTVLVYDLGGGTFDAAVVRFAADGGYEVLGHAAQEDTGGRDIDALLVAWAVEHADAELVAALTPAQGESATARLAALLAGLIVEDLVRELKHHVSDQSEAELYLTPLLPPLRLTREDLESLIDPLVERTTACFNALLSSLSLAVEDLTAVLQTGGSSRIPLIGGRLVRTSRPVRRPDDFDLAVVRGAARWAGGVPTHSVRPRKLERVERPLRWQLPLGQSAQLTSWHVRPGEAYPQTIALATVRLQDGSLWQLHDHATPDAVAVLQHIQVGPGDPVMSGDWLATVHAPSPELVLTVRAQVSDMVFGMDESALATITGNHAILWDLTSGRELVAVEKEGPIAIVRSAADLPWPCFAATNNSTLRLADRESEIRRVEFAGHADAVAADAGFVRIAVLCRREREVYVFDGNRGRKSFEVLRRWRSIAVKEPGGIVVWDESGQGEILSGETGERDVFDHSYAAASGRLVNIQFNADFTRLASADEDGSCAIWDVESKTRLLYLGPPEPDTPSRVALSPDGRSLAVATSSVVRIWRIARL